LLEFQSTIDRFMAVRVIDLDGSTLDGKSRKA